jgi:hypothetical protein
MLKKLLLVLVAGMIAGVTAAQKSSLQDLTYGAEIGPNLSGAILLKDPDAGSSAKGAPGPGIEFGILAELPLPAVHLSIRPRLQYSYESFSATVWGQKYPVHGSMLKLPIDLIYRPGKDNPWFFGAGPYVAMALGGKYKFNQYSETIGFGSDPNADMSKKFDAGLDLLAGYKVTPNIFVSADLNVGVLNIVNDAYWGSGYAGHSLNFGITGGYVFGGK